VPEDVHAEAIATVRAFAAASGAQRVVLLLDLGGDRPTSMIDLGADGSLELTRDGATTTLAAGAPAGAPPRTLPPLSAVPATAMTLDPDTGELAAPLGVVAHLGDAVLALARAFGGRSVATADFATRDPDVPLTIAAREGEPLVLAAGDRRFLLPT